MISASVYQRTFSSGASILVAVVAAITAYSVAAQSFPIKTVKITSAYPVGAGPDLTARLIAEKLTKYWGQSVVVEARPGGNGVIAMEAAKKSMPDGYEILVAGGGHLVINPILFKDLPYDTERDFAPVAALFQAPSMLTVSANGPYNSLADILAAARAKPGQIPFGTQYIGSTQHLGGVMIEQLSNTKMLHVAFKENAPLFTALINGDTAWSLTTIATGQPFFKSGRVKYVAHTNKTPLAGFPKLPTMEQAGLPGMNFSVWAGMVVPKATPAERVAFLSRDINRAMAEPDFQEKLTAFGFVAEQSSPANFDALIRSDIKLYTDVIKRGNIKVEAP
ncbi:MAG: Bug family tripartite tricarboxylate transporter substrate binding protein [Burkholderiales bacterium]